MTDQWDQTRHERVALALFEDQLQSAACAQIMQRAGDPAVDWKAIEKRHREQAEWVAGIACNLPERMINNERFNEGLRELWLKYEIPEGEA